MLKLKKTIIVIQNAFIIILILLTVLMFAVRYRMYKIMNNLVYLDNRIEKLQSDKNLLRVELTYLTSTERLLSLLEHNPKILKNKNLIKIIQVKTKEELEDISLAKSVNSSYRNKKLAQAK